MSIRTLLTNLVFERDLWVPWSPLGFLGVSWGYLVLLGVTWGYLGVPWGSLGVPLGFLGVSWGLWISWDFLGPFVVP